MVPKTLIQWKKNIFTKYKQRKNIYSNQIVNITLDVHFLSDSQNMKPVHRPSHTEFNIGTAKKICICF